jgi:hypothetical protein
MRGLKLATLTVAIVVSGLATSGAMAAGPTLAAVKKNGVVTCGVSTGLAGFSMPDKQGKYTGIDADTCRQLAAAIFGDATKVKFAPLSAQQRFTALQSGEVDILTRNTTWSLLRDTQLGLNFAPPTFYDGQGFMVAKKLGVKSVKDLNGATICVQPGTLTELARRPRSRVKLARKCQGQGSNREARCADRLFNEIRNIAFAGRAGNEVDPDYQCREWSLDLTVLSEPSRAGGLDSFFVAGRSIPCSAKSASRSL